MTMASERINPILNKHSVLNKEDRETVIRYCIQTLAGPEAERSLDPDGFFPQHSENDYGQIAWITRHVEGRAVFRKKMLKDVERRTKEIVKGSWEEIQKVAQALYQRKTLSGEEVKSIIAELRREAA